MFKKIAIRILLLAAIVALLNVCYNFTFFKADLLEKSPELVLLQKTVNETDIYYFGESSNTSFVEDDSLKNSISEFVSMFYPNLVLTNINRNATHAGIYRYWIKQFESRKKLPSAIIVTLNLRSFNAAWINSSLETPLQESLVLMGPYPNIVNRFLLALQSFDNKPDALREKQMLETWKTSPLNFPYKFNYKTVREWDDAMAAGGHLNADGSWNEAKIVLACHYIKAYGINLNQKNPRVKDFDEIYEWCNNNNVSLYLNLLAENMHFADSLVGKDLVFLMQQNRDFLVERYHKGNCKVVDNLEMVSSKDFIDKDWTTEHYKYRGRMTVAKNVADSMKNQFSNEYKIAY